MTIPENHRTILNEIKKHGTKSKGNTFLKKYLTGVRLTQRQAILSKCADCMGYHADGRYDCGIEACPLYPYMPYKGKNPPE